MVGQIVFVEDSLARVTEIRRLLDLYRSGGAVRDGARLAPMRIAPEQYWDPSFALERITGGANPDSPPNEVAQTWSADDLLFMDCWDRDALDDQHARSTFFALDLLRGLRSTVEFGRPIPRVIVHSRGMSDDLLRAALAEFVTARRQVRVPGESPVIRWRRDLGAPSDGGVIWAMFDRSDFERNLDAVLHGDRTRALREPDSVSPLWDQIEPSSCLASFHCVLRDECPDVWTSVVAGRPDVPYALDDTDIARVTRIAKKYLAFNEAWGARGYRAYLSLARQLANPGR